MFILTGSAVPPDDATRHTGAGRFGRLRMRPMSLAASAVSTRQISLAGLLAGDGAQSPDPGVSVLDLIEEVVRGGWPGLRGLELPAARRAVRDYLDQIARTDISAVDGVRRDPTRVRLVTLAVAAMGATPETLLADLNTFGLLFESMVIRDLRVYGQACDAQITHYRDSGGLEIDAIVSAGSGAWAALEIKLAASPEILDPAAENAPEVRRARRHEQAWRTGSARCHRGRGLRLCPPRRHPRHPDRRSRSMKNPKPVFIGASSPALH
jgi:Domain of unknown function (DUF4143)